MDEIDFDLRRVIFEEVEVLKRRREIQECEEEISRLKSKCVSVWKGPKVRVNSTLEGSWGEILELGEVILKDLIQNCDNLESLVRHRTWEQEARVVSLSRRVTLLQTHLRQEYSQPSEPSQGERIINLLKQMAGYRVLIKSETQNINNARDSFHRVYCNRINDIAAQISDKREDSDITPEDQSR